MMPGAKVTLRINRDFTRSDDPTLVIRCRSVKEPSRERSGLRASLVAVLLGAAVAGCASLASRLSVTDPDQLDAAPSQPPALMVTADNLTPTPLDDAVKDGLPTTTTPTTTTAPTTTTTPTTQAPRPTSTVAPPTHTAPAPPATSANPGAGQAAQLVAYVNYIREQAGCYDLHEVGQLDSAAAQHSQQMAQSGTVSAGHNQSVAQGETSAGQVIETWMRSRRDAQNVLNCDYATIGVGVDTSGWYWTADFGE